MKKQPAAPPRLVPLTRVFVQLARVTIRTREQAVARMALLECLGQPQVPTYQTVLAEWFRSDEYRRALAIAGMPDNEDVRELLTGCEMLWPRAIWSTDYADLPKQYVVDLYKLQVLPISAA